jgi:hypothetical protein
VKVTKFFFYLLLLFIPVQLGKHFFFDFSYISGIRIDYLAPTIYLTDVISLLMVGSYFIQSRKFPKKPIIKLSYFHLLLFVICFLLFNAIFVSANKWLALYKLAKIFQLFSIFIVIYNIKPDKKWMLLILSIGIFMSSTVAIWQFILQRSIGGLLYYLGERDFYATSPGIAATYFWGKLILRPYSTFPHPNVLGGYLVIIGTYIISEIKYIKKGLRFVLQLLIGVSFVSAVMALILTFSRLSYVVFLTGIFVMFVNTKYKPIKITENTKYLILIFLYLLILFSIFIFMFLPENGQSFTERKDLINIALKIISSGPFFGIGLNNYIIHVKDKIVYIKELYFLQPVHNVFLLVASETGIAGLLMLIFICWKLMVRYIKINKIYPVLFIQLLIIGLFDHYLYTLQQGMMIVTVFTAIYLLPQEIIYRTKKE